MHESRNYTDPLCANEDPELFEADPMTSEKARDEAKLICLRCVDREYCLDRALSNDEKYNVYGALTPRERKKLVIALSTDVLRR